jgi:hypothetical protein
VELRNDGKATFDPPVPAIPEFHIKKQEAFA